MKLNVNLCQRSIPNDLNFIYGLEELYLSFNYISEIPGEFKRHRQIVAYCVINGKHGCVPHDSLVARRCYLLSRQIQIMDFGNNCLASLPDALIQESYFPSVRECILQGNSLVVSAQRLHAPRGFRPGRVRSSGG